jgi:hypothetical protein
MSSGNLQVGNTAIVSNENPESGDVNKNILASIVAAIQARTVKPVPIGIVPNAPDTNLDNILSHMPYLGFIEFEDRLFQLLKNSLITRMNELVQIATTIRDEKKSIMDGAAKNLTEATETKEAAEIEKSKTTEEVNRIKSVYDASGPGGKGLLAEQYDNAKKEDKLAERKQNDSVAAYTNAVNLHKIATDDHNTTLDTHFQAKYKLNEIQNITIQSDFYKVDFQNWLLGVDTTEKQVYANTSSTDNMKNKKTSYTDTYSKYFTAYIDRKRKYDGATRVETIETSHFEEFALIDHHDEYDRAIMGKQSGGERLRTKIINKITTDTVNATKQGATTAFNATNQGLKQFSNQPITTTRNAIPSVGRRISDIREADSKGAVYYSGKTDIRKVIRLDNFNFTRYCNGYVWFLAAWIYSPELGYFHLKDLDVYGPNKVNPRFFWNLTKEIKQKDGSSVKTFRYFNTSNVLIGDKKDEKIQLYETDISTKQIPTDACGNKIYKSVSLLHNQYLQQIVSQIDDKQLIMDITQKCTGLSQMSIDKTNCLFDWVTPDSIYYPEKYQFDTKITPDLGVPYFMMGCLTPDKNVIFYPHLERGQHTFFMSKDDYMKEMDYMDKEGDARRKEEARRQEEEAHQKAAIKTIADILRKKIEDIKSRKRAEEDRRRTEEDKKTAIIVAAIDKIKQEAEQQTQLEISYKNPELPHDEEERNKIAAITALDEKRKQELRENDEIRKKTEVDRLRREQEENERRAEEAIAIVASIEKIKRENSELETAYRKTESEQLEDERNKIASLIAADEKIKQELRDQEEARKKTDDALDLLEKDRLEKDRLEKDRLDRLEKDRLEKARLEQEEKDRLEKARLEQEDKDRLEKARLEQEEKDRLEKARLEQEENDRKILAAILGAITQTPVVITSIFDYIDVLFVENTEKVSKIANDIKDILRFHLYYERLNKYMKSLIQGGEAIMKNINVFNKVKRGITPTLSLTDENDRNAVYENAKKDYSKILNPKQINIRSTAESYVRNIYDYQSKLVDDIRYFSIPIRFMSNISDDDVNAIQDSSTKAAITALIKQCSQINEYLNNLTNHETTILRDIEVVKDKVENSKEKSPEKMVNTLGKRLTDKQSKINYMNDRLSILHQIYDSKTLNSKMTSDFKLHAGKDASHMESTYFNTLIKGWHTDLFAALKSTFIKPFQTLNESFLNYTSGVVDNTKLRTIKIDAADNNNTKILSFVNAANGVNKDDPNFLTKNMAALIELKTALESEVYTRTRDYVQTTGAYQSNITPLSAAIDEMHKTTDIVKAAVIRKGRMGALSNNSKTTPNVFLYTNVVEIDAKKELSKMGYGDVANPDYSVYLQDMFTKSKGSTGYSHPYHYLFLVPYIRERVMNEHSLTLDKISALFKSNTVADAEGEVNLGGADYFESVGSTLENGAKIYDLQNIYDIMNPQAATLSETQIVNPNVTNSTKAVNYNTGRSGNNRANPPLVNQPPADKQPADKQPADKPPANEQPANEPPANEQPANEQPANQPPANQPPANQPLVNEPPANEPPANEPLVNEQSADKPPVNQPPVNKSRVKTQKKNGPTAATAANNKTLKTGRR